ncbi:MAG: hypothetical protein F4X82_01345 [Candidatus Spechtbacteria bacterium SB0662_bin_43]|uniref:DUF3800 domain-containing protein n=1 Tax=Candidatus Spechtbacteria bacterium SB0662_bin_43 TaxID=2604897 RepID=A0A845D8U6_9BACT|nr:hypothetical protein [Candidatus Spechtbacteria bacterium SB0662_bin_43]
MQNDRNFYRLYVDESGDHNYSKKDDPENRYLSLIGVVVSYNDNQLLSKRWKKLRDLFTDDLDFPVFSFCL